MLIAVLYRHVWGGFVYFVLAILSVLALLWGVYFIIQYFTSFKEELKVQYEIYITEKINKLNISKEEYQESEQAFKKDFKKSVILQKLIKWAAIAFCFAISVAFIWAMFLTK